MPPSFELVVCITSTALFDCRESNNIWKTQGLEAYKAHQKASAQEPLKPGVGFHLVRSLLKLNDICGKELVDVVLISRNDGESSERVRNSIDHYKIPITRMSFTSGEDVTRYLPAWKCDLFLSTEEDQVRIVLSAGNSSLFENIAAGLVCHISNVPIEFVDENETCEKPSNETSSIGSKWPNDQIRIVFDGDGVLFSDEAESIYRKEGLEAFRQSEKEKTKIALPKGPMHSFAVKLQHVRERLADEHKWRIRTFLVTARNGVANERAMNTLKQWGLEINEAHFLGGLDKTQFLTAIQPTIFFDDSTENIDKAKKYVPSAHVVYGVSNVKQPEST